MAFWRLHRDESGATAIEYGLIAALIGVVIIAALVLTSNSLSNTYNYVSNQVDKASP